jgi:hypothetical protein
MHSKGSTNSRPSAAPGSHVKRFVLVFAGRLMLTDGLIEMPLKRCMKFGRARFTAQGWVPGHPCVERDTLLHAAYTVSDGY